jgi:shikimate dehydrogenase
MTRAAVLGSPIQHSLSPLLHTSIYRFLGIEGTYSAIEVRDGELQEFFTGNRDNFDYLSLTMPLKEEALSLDVNISSLAKKSQSANTLYRIDGHWHLTSTDGLGFLEALSRRGIERSKNVLVLGAGGTARALVAALDSHSHKIDVLGRTMSRKDSFEAICEKSAFQYLRWSDTPDFSNYDLVVNTTPAGAADVLADSLPSSHLPLLFDVIYKPWPTVLASRWHDRGGAVINGLDLLMHQGIIQVELALNTTIDRASVTEYLLPILKAAH